MSATLAIVAAVIGGLVGLVVLLAIADCLSGRSPMQDEADEFMRR